MSFRDIYGQEKAVSILQRAWQNGRLAHAYLFVGLEGIGKKLTAFTLTKALNCLAPPIIGDSCDRCSSCQQVDSTDHPDLIFIEPSGGVIKIDQIRDLQERLRFRPWTGKFRVCIIEAVENLNAAAANAFLKTLEEPPQDTYLFLITSRPHQLLPTILSRCQWLKFQALPVEEIVRILRNKHSFPDEQAIFLATLGEGSVGRALALSQRLDFSKRLEWAKTLSSLTNQSFTEISAFSAAMSEEEQINDLLELGKIWARDLLVYKVQAEAKGKANCRLINHDLYRQIAEEAPKYSWADLDFLFKRLSQGQRSIEQRGNRQLVLETLMLDLRQKFQKEN